METINYYNLTHHETFMNLKLFVDTDDSSLLMKYKEAVQKHNHNFTNNQFVDAGFDLFIPTTFSHKFNSINKVDFKVKCSAQICNIMDDSNYAIHNTGFYMYPRSSLSKTNLRLANSVGIIDSGYRGNLIGMFDCIYSNTDTDTDTDTNHKIPEHFIQTNKFDRLTQICAPGLLPIYVQLVSNVEVLGDTIRGTGGFGSTGK